jgi:hypothetical protein
VHLGMCPAFLIESVVAGGGGGGEGGLTGMFRRIRRQLGGMSRRCYYTSVAEGFWLLSQGSGRSKCSGRIQFILQCVLIKIFQESIRVGG